MGRIVSRISANSTIADGCNDPYKMCGTESGVGAYTIKGGTTIWFCSSFFTESQDAQVGDVLHEYSHLAAYTSDEIEGGNNALSWPNYGKWAYFYSKVGQYGFNSAMTSTFNDIGIAAKGFGYVK
jgi:hypothetical protein